MGYVRDGCRISGGSVRFDGQELVGAAPETLRRLRGLRIAYVAQSAAASFNPAHRLIDQHIETAVKNGGIDRAKAEAEAVELYRVLRLPDPEHIGQRYPHQVSGGQLQRVMTAMAMACHPDLIVFDEPTTALDVTTQIEVLTAIRDAVRTYGSAALYISHDLALVAQIADRIMVLRHGSLVEEAQTRAMLQTPPRTTPARYGRCAVSTPSPKRAHPRPSPCLRCARPMPATAPSRCCMRCRSRCIGARPWR